MNNKISVDELDFEGIKTNLKGFLSGQTAFKDYNFEGSNMNILLDLLAYNTYYNGIYNNMTLNEVFLDSASNRSSVLSAIKPLSYIPRSYRASKAHVKVEIQYASDVEQLILYKGYKFTSNKNGATLSFVLNEDRVSFRNSNGLFVFDALPIYSGNYITQSYVVDGKTRFMISNPTVDTSTLKVTVYPNMSNNSGYVYTLADNLTSLKFSHNVYFLKENENGLYEIEFGDDVLVRALDFGAVVSIEYVATQGTSADDCNIFSCQLVDLLNAKVKVQTINNSIGWEAKESIESIKFNAPKANAAQNRCITPSDYCAIARKHYDNIDSIVAWGGESNVPVAYNTTFLCIKPKYSQFLTPSEKSNLIQSVLLPKAIPDAKVQIVDVEYTNLQVESTVYYISTSTNESAATITDIVKLNILKQAESSNNFYGIFRYSPLVAAIDNSDSSIQNNITTVRLYKTIAPKININGRYTISLNNSIEQSEDCVKSSGFYLQDKNDVYYLANDVSGNIYTYFVADGAKIKHENVGTVDFKKGLVVINDLNIAALNTADFRFYFVPTSYDVVTSMNQILILEPNDVSVSIIDEAYSAHRNTSIHV